MLNKNKIKNQKGVSLYLALVIMTIFLAMGLGLTAISLSQKKMVRGIDYSVIVLSAADTGVEEMLYLDKRCNEAECCNKPEWPGCGHDDPCKDNCSGVKSGHSLKGELDYGAIYQVKISRNCGVNTIWSDGVFEEVKRALEVTYGKSKVGKYLNSATNKNCTELCNDIDCACGYIQVSSVKDDLYWHFDEVCTTSAPSGCNVVMFDQGVCCPSGSPPPCPPPPPEEHEAMWTYCDCGEKTAEAKEKP